MANLQKKTKILNIVGARPNFMKIAPLFRAYEKHQDIKPILVHTGQHTDNLMSDIFFQSLGIPKPDYKLEIDHSSPVATIHSIMSALEPIFKDEKPDLVIVVGDVNSTLAGALAANKAGVKLAHVEAGLRSGDRNMPEEINRIVIDHMSDMVFVTEESGMSNLKKEGVPELRTFFVGNVMIDNLIGMMPKIDSSKIMESIGLGKEPYIVMTMHRPVNVDSKENLMLIKNILKKVSDLSGIKVIFPMHPRTKNRLREHGLLEEVLGIGNHVIIEPLDYIDFIKLVKNSSLVLTDSGGIQEEAAHLKVPVITLRESTERPSTIICGANTLHSLVEIESLMEKIKLAINTDRGFIKEIPLWDGKASERIIDIITKSQK